MMRLRESGITLDWLLEPGPLNAITDVPGVRVGHATLASPDPAAQTGVTVVLPHARSASSTRLSVGWIFSASSAW